MSDKEWLEQIKSDWVNEKETYTFQQLTLEEKDIEWLIKQAERAIEGEEELDRWLSGRNVAISTYEELRTLREENVRLREALYKIVNLNWNEIMHHENAYGIARRALKSK